MSQPNKSAEIEEFIAEAKQVWLKDRGMTFVDVLMDDDGEYVLEEPTLMDEGEPEDDRPRKVYIPDFTDLL